MEKLEQATEKLMHTADKIGLWALCGEISTPYDSAIAAIFFTCEIPPECTISG